MRRLLGPWLVAMAVGAVLAGCGSKKDPAAEEAAQAAAAPEVSAPVARAQVIGEIASVNTTDSFVLIRRTGGRSLPPGMVYSSIGKDGRTAALHLTGERLGRFFAADIRAGEPAAGDLVIARALPAASQPEITPAAPSRAPNRPAGLPDLVR